MGKKNLNKKNIVFVIVAILALIWVGKQIARLVDIHKALKKEITIVFCGDFDPQDHEEAIRFFSSDKKVEPILDADTAGKIAEDFWRRKWGTDGNPGDVTEVYYNTETGYWLVRGTIPQEWFDNWTLGVRPYAIIHESGDVIAIWQE